jgi:hypothetical protein
MHFERVFGGLQETPPQAGLTALVSDHAAFGD